MSNELQPGMTIRGKYQIVDKIGSGGMASVYRARHIAFGEVFAIKVVSTLLAGTEDFLRRFKAEAIITRKLRHPNAVRVDDLDFTEDGRPYIVMEYVEGQSLRKVIQEQGALGVPRSIAIARQVAGALGAAHALGIIHRDIKPDNILIVNQPDGSDLVKVLDFGIAKVKEGALDLGEGYAPTQTGIVVGTPQYISPEQALGMKGDAIDGRADIYSLGVVLYELLTGDLPFHSDTAMGVILHHIQTAPRPPRDLRPDLGIPQTLSDVLMKTLAKDPGRRFQNAAELLQALGRPHDSGTAVNRRAPAVAAGPPAPRAVAGNGVRPPAVRNTSLTAAHLRTMPAARIEPVSPGGGGSFVPNRWVLMIGTFALLAVGAGLMLPSPPPAKKRPAATVSEGATAGATVAAAETPGAPPPHVPAAAAPVPHDADDQRLASEVKARLASAESLRGAVLEATFANGVVTLQGSAHKSQIEIATALATSVAGVEQVRSLVAVVDDREAAAPVPAAAQDPKLKQLMEDGYAELGSGNLDSAIERFRAAVDVDPSYGPARLALEQAVAVKTNPR